MKRKAVRNRSGKSYPGTKHEASKRGYKHEEQIKSFNRVAKVHEEDENGNRETTTIFTYKHGATYGKEIPSNHLRVTAQRASRLMVKGLDL